MKTNIKTTHNNNNIKNSKNAKNNRKKIRNWSEYNKSLKNRGNISIFISETLIKDGCLIMPTKTGKPGRPLEYTDELIEFVLTIRELFHLPLRQATGFLEFLFGLMRIASGSPDYTTVSKRMPDIKVHYRRKIAQSVKNNAGIVILIDSSGFKVFGEGEWMVKKHGASYRRTWRETHIALDYYTRDIIGFTNTDAHVHDNTQLEPLLKQVSESGYNISTIIGDGAYDSKDNYLEFQRKRQIEFIAPPPKNAIEHLNTGWHYQWYDTPGWEERNKVVGHIEEFGLDGWKNDVDYHRRSLVENAFYRWKTIFGGNLKSRKDNTQYTEQCLRAKIINKFNELGLPQYEITN